MQQGELSFNERPTQEAQILVALQAGARLTALDALERFKCFRLASRISQLKKEGHPIKCERVKVASGKVIAEYRLA